MRQTLLLQRVLGNPAAMTAREALEIATLGGAAVLGRDDIGSLAPGMAADVAAFDLDDLWHSGGAVHDPIAALVFWDASNITRAVNYGMGPQTIPQAIAGFVAILGVAHLVVAFRGGFNIETEAVDPVAIGWILFGLVFLIASIPLGLGFIIAMTVLCLAHQPQPSRRCTTATPR